MNLRCYKFMIPAREERIVERYPDGSVLKRQGVSAGAVAETEAEAREIIAADFERYGDDPRWLKVATVKILDLDKPKLLWVAEL